MPIYLVEQKGVPGARLIEAEKPAGAINHVIDSSFTAKRLDGRELLDAAKLYDLEVAGVKPADPPPPAGNEEEHQQQDAGDGQGNDDDNLPGDDNLSGDGNGGGNQEEE